MNNDTNDTDTENNDYDDLYKDLNNNNNEQQPFQKPFKQNHYYKQQQSLHKQQEEQINMIHKLQKDIIALQEENNILKRNMGILYRTAKVELERKDSRIMELERRER